MDDSNNFTQYLKELQLQIMMEPDKKYRLILKALKQTKFRAGKRKIKKLLNGYKD